MLRQPSATPCPVPSGHILPHRRDSILGTGDDTTSNIDFTSAFGQSLKGVKPKRRQTAVRRNDNALEFAIFEDHEAKGKRTEPLNALAQPARRSVIAQPPQRPNYRVSFMPSNEAESLIPDGKPKATRRLSQVPPRRPVIKYDGSSKEQLASLPEDAGIDITSKTMLKPARRGTIYIPSDDTTMPSMYMGIFSPIKDLDTRAIAKAAAAPESELTGIAAQMVKKRVPRRSMIAASPKRGPLQIVAKPLQETTVVEDQHGQGTGKENVPPGQCSAKDGRFMRRASIMPKRPIIEHRLADEMASLNLTTEAKPSRIFDPTASSLGRTMERNPSDRASDKPGWNAGARVRISQPVTAKRRCPKASPVQIQERLVEKKPTVPTRFVIPNIKPKVITQSYPLLTEDLATPSMYEDNWLSHQEIAITQLVNNLFGSSSPESATAEDGILRIRLLEIYGNSENAMLHKRLQGAVFYGALSVPAESLKASGRLCNDVGRRKAFTDLWLETYDISCLKAALEVVVGRQCGTSTTASPVSRRSSNEGANRVRQALRRFIETFLIRNEDGSPDEGSSDRPSWSYQRTLLRSLMLIKLLDLGKALDSHIVSGCLFQPTSNYKSSVSIVQALFQMLNPSAGDPTRALSYIGYTVGHSQYPLEEYTYKIDNLAVDLRDGVRLTRLVELLLYPSAAQLLEHAHDSDATTTVLLPTGELLSLTEGQRDWPLSQHLKFPCLSRATKLYNVSIALSSLQGVKGMKTLVHDITAEDIVDGFREKTVRLLWGLTSKWGLGGLVDWTDVEREIKRMCRAVPVDPDDDFLDVLEDDEEGYARYKALLKSWAQAIADQKGIAVRNLTTSFADGRAFEAIVDEYEPHLASETNHKCRKQLSERLKVLGCSAQFASLFADPNVSPNQVHVFDRDFVMAALAFLCSRLLGPSKTARAAVTIQKAWRKYWGRVMCARKCQLKMVAESCAEAVRAKVIKPENKATQKELCNVPNNDKAESGWDKRTESCQYQDADEEDIWLNL